MGLFSTLNTGVSGLGVNSSGMNVIGDNIANVNTVGFKSSRVNFSDLVQRSASTGALGLGSTVSGIGVNFGQGGLENTTNVTDLALTGRGFFVLRNPNIAGDRFFSRAGSFYLDPNGRLTNDQGYFLQGYTSTGSGRMTATVDDIVIDTGVLPPQATAQITLTGNLDSRVQYDATREIDPTAFDGSATTYTFDDLDDMADFTITVTVYDSQGEPHDLTTFFQRAAANNTWNYYTCAIDSEVDSAYRYGVEDAAFLTEAGTIEFNTDGGVDAVTVSALGGTTSQGMVTYDGASDQHIEVDFADKTDLTQYGEPSSLAGITQDGHSAGYLSYLDVDDSGIITGVYSNGERSALGQLAIGTFASEAGLVRQGDGVYGQTPESGASAIGKPNTGGRGSVTAYALEMSNVNLEAEFVKMIQSQTGYQANSRVINTTDQMLQDLIQNIG